MIKWPVGKEKITAASLILRVNILQQRTKVFVGGDFCPPRGARLVVETVNVE